MIFFKIIFDSLLESAWSLFFLLFSLHKEYTTKTNKKGEIQF